MRDGYEAGHPNGNSGPERGSGFRVLVGNEPLGYRDVMAAALQDLRPDVEVVEVEPAALDGEVLRRRPQLVVCSELSEVVQTRAFAWILIYPAGANLAVICIGGRQTTIPRVVFGDVLAAIDRVVALAGVSPELKVRAERTKPLRG